MMKWVGEVICNENTYPSHLVLFVIPDYYSIVGGRQGQIIIILLDYLQSTTRNPGSQLIVLRRAGRRGGRQSERNCSGLWDIEGGPLFGDLL